MDRKSVEFKKVGRLDNLKKIPSVQRSQPKAFSELQNSDLQPRERLTANEPRRNRDPDFWKEFSIRASPTKLSKVGTSYYTPSCFSPRDILQNTEKGQNGNATEDGKNEKSTESPDLKINNSFGSNRLNESIALTAILPSSISQKTLGKDIREVLLHLASRIKKLEDSINKKNKQIHQINKDSQLLYKKVTSQQRLINQFHQIVSPYQNNVALMQTTLEALQKKLKQVMENDQFPSDQKENGQESILGRSTLSRKFSENQNGQVRSTARAINENQIRSFYQQKIEQLNANLEKVIGDNLKLHQSNTISENHNALLQQVLLESERASQYREQYLMTSEELSEYKNKYKQSLQIKEKLSKFNAKLQNKVKMLVSLVGYGTISEIKSNQLDQLISFTENVGKCPMSINLTNDVTGISSLSAAKNKNLPDFRQILDCESKSATEILERVLYRPNFMIFFEYSYRDIINQIEENYNNSVIKPDFFLHLRAMQDSYYTQMKIYQGKCDRFPDFVQTFTESFKVKENYKRIIHCPILNHLQMQDRQSRKIGFLIKLLDRKIAKLPQVITFREFVFKQTPQDQVFYYLAIRNILHSGAQLLNPINCSDPFVYVNFQQITFRLKLILDGYDKRIRQTIYSNIESKKVKKIGKWLIRPTYVCRLLLELYRKTKQRKNEKIKEIFDNVYSYNKLPTMKYMHFKQIIQKNFGAYLTGIDICRLYRQAAGVFHCQKSATSFFECFWACCSEQIFLKELLFWEKDLVNRLNENDFCDVEIRNQLMKLFPESIAELGIQPLQQNYIKLLKNPHKGLTNRLQVLSFLIKIVQGQVVGNFLAPKREDLQEKVNSLIEYTTNWINGNFRERQNREGRMEAASKALGSVFRKKVYEFYQEFILDTNKELMKNRNPNKLQ